MQQLRQTGWRRTALALGAALILLAGYAAVSGTSTRSPAAKKTNLARAKAPAVHPKPLPLPDYGATLDASDPAPGYQAALFSGTVRSTPVVVAARLTEVSVPVRYGVQTVFDAKLALGREVVAQTGTLGVAVETVRRVYDGNKVISVSVVGEKVVRSARPEVVHVGAELPDVSRGELAGRVVGTLAMSATAYWANPAWSNGRTATGVAARYGVAAVDPSVIPLGTRLYVPGYGYAVAADTGGAIVGDRIDLCFDTGQQAIDFGRQSVTVYELSSN